MDAKKSKILKAWWIAPNRVLAVFERDFHEIPSVSFSAEADVGRFRVIRSSRELFARYASYFTSDGQITFVLRSTDGAHISRRFDYYVCGSFNSWGSESVDMSLWKMKPSPNNEFRLTVPFIRTMSEVSEASGAFVDASRKGAILFKFRDSLGRWLEPSSIAPNGVVGEGGIRNLRVFRERGGSNMIEAEFESYSDWLSPLKVRIDGDEVSVDSAALLRELYSDKPLGTFLKNGATRFSIFAPRASIAKVVWHFEGENVFHEIFASKGDGAVWVADAESDLNGARYMWHIGGVNSDATTNFDFSVSVADPYALAMDSSSGECVVSYASEVCVPSQKFAPPAWHDLVIMEAHLRDVLARANVDLLASERLTFDGLTKWLSSPECYLRKTGVNCVELQPVQEFTAEKRTDYEWGYMPVNWFAPSSSYAKSPKESTQIEDFRKLVSAFHKAGIAVILDVVYNHTGEPNYMMRADKEYYFELSRDGSFMNYSGCGNDFRADAPMSRRLIIDSLKYFVEKFDVDGFRFDLAELIGVSTLLEVERVLKSVKPSIILIAEPWSFRGRITGELSDTGWASWNDGFREFMLKYAQGFGDFEGFKFFTKGSHGMDYRFQAQSVNYLESHDDMCLFDRIAKDRENPSTEDLRRFKLSLALVLNSIGIPMLAEGCDLVRTKGGLNNTYKNGTANALDYIRASRFTGVAEWVRNMIAFRKSDAARALRLSHPPSSEFFKFIPTDTTAGGVLFNADSSLSGARKILALYNPTSEYRRIISGLDVPSDFKLIADIDRFDSRGLDPSCEIVAADDDKFGRITSILMPPVSFQLWIER